MFGMRKSVICHVFNLSKTLDEQRTEYIDLQRNFIFGFVALVTYLKQSMESRCVRDLIASCIRKKIETKK